MLRSIGPALLAGALLFSFSNVAWAQDPAAQPAGDDARTRFLRGQTAYQQGDYETAIREWTAAYEQDPRPLLQYNLSQAFERLARVAEAIAALERYLETAAPDDPNQAPARARVASLRSRLEQTGIRVQGGPEGATILVDDQDMGRTPRPDPVRVAPGSHRVVVRMAGYEDFVSNVVAQAGNVVDVAVEMQVAAAAPHETSPWPFVVMGAGGAVVVIGVVLGLVANGKANDAVYRDGPEADAARRFAVAADISMGVGLLTAGAGLLWLLLAGGDDEEAPRAGSARLRLAPTLSPSELGARATVSF